MLITCHFLIFDISFFIIIVLPILCLIKRAFLKVITLFIENACAFLLNQFAANVENFHR